MAGFNHWTQMAHDLKPQAQDVVKKTADDLAGWAASGAPYQTGFLHDSIYVKTWENSTYGQAGSPPGDSYLLPEVDAPPDDTTAYVAVGANYGAFVNYGTRFMAAEPFWEPAIDTAQGTMDTLLEQLPGNLTGNVS